MNVVETLQAEHTELTAKLNEMDERIRTERPGIVAQISQLNKAIIALTKPASTPGTRKPMSEAGKAAIRAGLEKARATKLAAGEQPNKPHAAPAPVTQAVESSNGKKPVAGDKGTARGN